MKIIHQFSKPIIHNININKNKSNTETKFSESLISHLSDGGFVSDL